MQGLAAIDRQLQPLNQSGNLLLGSRRLARNERRRREPAVTLPLTSLRH